MTVLVTGATGKVGRRVLDELVQRGQVARPATRRSSVPLDWTEPSGWEAVLSNVERIFLVLPGGDDGHRSVEGLGGQAIRFLELAEKRGIEKVVFMTALGMEYAPDDADLRAAELHLQATRMQWTIIRPNWFYQNFTEGGALYDLAKAEGGKLRLPAGDAVVSFIDARDIAAVIAITLTDDHAGREYTLTGPQGITFTDLATIASKASFAFDSYEPVSDAYFRSSAAALGWHPDYVETLSTLFASAKAGGAADVLPDAATILGRNPISFGEFVTEHM